jgi:hypothetical protein
MIKLKTVSFNSYKVTGIHRKTNRLFEAYVWSKNKKNIRKKLDLSGIDELKILFYREVDLENEVVIKTSTHLILSKD